MPSILINTTYNTDTRELRSDVTLAGFVPEVPGQISVGGHVDTINIAGGDALQASDFAVLQVSIRRALDVANDDLLEWQKVVDNPDKAIAFVAATAPPDTEEPEEPAP